MKNNFDIKGYDPSFMENISRNIRKYREEANLSRIELAKMVGVTDDFLKKIENSSGTKGLSLKTLYKISLVLNIAIDRFFINNQ